jgi:homoserine/homoserine lactone efflux protein
MNIESWIIYLTLVIAATATPGPAVLFIVSSSTLYGWKQATYAALGNVVGLFCAGIIAVAGLGAILNTSVACFNILKYSGAAYLVYLGLKLIFHKNSSFSSFKGQKSLSGIASHRLFFQALFVAMGNPKAIVFLTALLPQFINIEGALLPQFAILIATLMFFSFFFLMLYSLLVQRFKGWLNKSGRRQNFNRASGSVFIGFGLLLAASSNK